MACLGGALSSPSASSYLCLDTQSSQVLGLPPPPCPNCTGNLCYVVMSVDTAVQNYLYALRKYHNKLLLCDSENEITLCLACSANFAYVPLCSIWCRSMLSVFRQLFGVVNINLIPYINEPTRTLTNDRFRSAICLLQSFRNTNVYSL